MEESLAGLQREVARLDEAARSLLPGIRARDHRVWGEDPTEIADRLGWLAVAERAEAEADRWRAVADGLADEVDDAVLVGMGGSSLFPMLLAEHLGPAAGRPGLHVVDTTDPAAVAAHEQRRDWARTAILASSKSGTTIEMRALLARYRRALGAAGDDRRVVAITDPGTPLAAQGEAEGFRAVVEAPADVGGRYSALTAFGLLPAALLGHDPTALLDPAATTLSAALGDRRPVGDPVRLGAVLAAAARAGRDKLTLRLPTEIAGLGAWIEQLVAESTGKSGTGLVPVLDEPLDADRFGDDRLVVAIGDAPGLDACADAGHPVLHWPWAGRSQLGAEVARWELATAIAGALLGVNPFDQPDVAAAKEATSRMLAEGEGLGPVDEPEAALAALRPGGYVALLGFVTPGGEDERRLRDAADRLRARTAAPVTVGLGPRYLHSTGQLHKGGPAGGVFLVAVGDDPVDLDVPGGEGLTFSRLKRAQAAGDVAALRARERTVARMVPAAL